MASKEIEDLRERKRELQQQLDRLTAAVAEGGHSSFLLDAISERERELAELEASAALTENSQARERQSRRMDGADDRPCVFLTLR